MGALLDKIRELSEKKIAPSWFRSREWYTVEPAIRRRSFFSATIQSAKVLTRMQTYLIDWMTNSTEQVTNPTTGAVETVYKINGLAEFRERMTTLMVSEGLVEPDQVPDQRITNVVSNSRLALIFNTNREQSTTFARWQRNMSNPDWLRRFPAARFLRRPGAVDPRPLHVANEGQVRKWDDPFWLEMNNAAIGGFEVPWGPYGFNSYMVQDPVTRAEAEALKVIRKGEIAKPPDVSYLGVDLGQQFNAGLEANIDDVTPEIRRQAEDDIRARFGNGAIGSDGKPTLDALKRLRTQITTGVLPPPANVPAAAPAQLATLATVGGPAGSKVSDKVNFGSITGPQTSVRQKWENVVNRIDSIHGDGPLPKSEVTHIEKNGSTNGQYRPFTNEITTFKEQQIPITYTHEIGHWIDYRGFKGIPEAEPPMKGNKVSASYSPLFKQFIKIAKNTSKYQEIKNNIWLANSTKKYLLSNHEIFARAYSQYIAVKSNDAEMLAVLKNRQGKWVNGKPYPNQWDDDDFIPLFDEIENIFKKVGWIKT